MRSRLIATLATLLVATALGAQRASNPREALVTPASWLLAHAKDPNLVILHVGDRGEYEKGHIPGGRYVATESLFVSDRTGAGLTLEMLPSDRLHDALEGLGISNDSRVVVYYDGERIALATRVIFALDYAGLGDRTSLLDGGLKGWTRTSNEVTTTPAPAKRGTLAVLTTKPIIVTADYVQSHLKSGGFSLVDGRTTAFYDGTQTGGGRGSPHKTGHIAGAKSVPYTDIVDTDWLLKTPEQLGALFAKAGVARGDTIVGYCHIGQQATAMLFAARTLGFPILLYDGSFEDWSRRDLPVEAKPKP